MDFRGYLSPQLVESSSGAEAPDASLQQLATRHTAGSCSEQCSAPPLPQPHPARPGPALPRTQGVTFADAVQPLALHFVSVHGTRRDGPARLRRERGWEGATGRHSRPAQLAGPSAEESGGHPPKARQRQAGPRRLLFRLCPRGRRRRQADPFGKRSAGPARLSSALGQHGAPATASPPASERKRKGRAAFAEGRISVNARASGPCQP